MDMNIIVKVCSWCDAYGLFLFYSSFRKLFDLPHKGAWINHGLIMMLGINNSQRLKVLSVVNMGINLKTACLDDEDDNISDLLRDLAAGLDDNGDFDGNNSDLETCEELVAIQKLVAENSKELYPNCHLNVSVGLFFFF
jgi:hypothetical protein